MKDSQKGSTLIEQIVIISVVGLILPALAGIFFQTFLGPVEKSAQLATAQDVQLSGDWISRDLGAGPMGNNLGLSGSSPSLASVTIGSSPGYPGNNSLAITYHTWQSAGNTSADNRSITYRLEDMDPTDDDIQLVRREDDGSVVVVAKHIANAADVVFSGSAETNPGSAPTGLNMSITSTLEGSTSTVTRQANIVYSVPRSYQPGQPTAPASQPWNVIVPTYHEKGTGFWQVITTAGNGNIMATWNIQAPTQLQLYIYSGQPMGSGLGDSIINPVNVTAPVVASASSNTAFIWANTAAPQPAGNYTLYFFNNSNSTLNSNSADATYVSP